MWLFSSIRFISGSQSALNSPIASVSSLQSQPPSRRYRLKKLLQYGAATFLGTQALAISTVIGIDELRKRRNPPSDTFEHQKPKITHVDGNQLKIFCFGKDLFEEMLADIRKAKRSVCFETFIIKNDVYGDLFRDALIEAAARGVEVYIIIDTWGTLNQPLKIRRFPAIPTLHMRTFPLLRPGILTGDIRRTGRDHRKLLIVDEEVGYVGGYNIGDLYATKWRDTHCRIAGPDARLLYQAFVDLWNDMDGRPRFSNNLPVRWNQHLRAVQNRPNKLSFPVRTMYIEMFERANKQIWLTTAYFVPGSDLLNSLMQAAQRGVDVRIIVPQYSNHIVVDWISSGYYEDLLSAGVRIFLFKNAMVHAKTMTVDGIWSTIGTANLDRMSLVGNFEINMEFHSPALANAMEEIFNHDLANCTELKIADWRKRSNLQRLAEKILSPLAPIV